MRRLTAAALAAGAALAAHASSLQISPVTVELPPGQNASALTLRNPGKEPVYGQVRVFRWDQAPDDDRLEPSDDLVASPPLIRIEPQGEQLVRLVRRDGSAVAEERYYRVLVDEVPNLDAAPGNGVNIRLRYSVPVFLEPAGAPALPKLSWELRREGTQWQLRVSNTGGRRAQLAAVRVVGADGAAQEINPGLLGYVLAGRTRQWTIALDDKLAAHGPLKLRANLNAQPIETELSVAARP
ncbi:fimbrial chaperone protein [Dyella sp. SG562]|uniref:fimbrial biogenesis chaperone n=1 Tax=unclassified Dyella TaxID=2634549 RepID=UPI00141E47E8|nr:MULTISPECIES: molecular chaperone [unclassified Dyella]NII71813.1 fimbrial chaperone protein [Dyella sp. SG562]NKJ21429.1 fimbrial chaperone protein [Dyella sp. SG609]